MASLDADEEEEDILMVAGEKLGQKARLKGKEQGRCTSLHSCAAANWEQIVWTTVKRSISFSADKSMLCN